MPYHDDGSFNEDGRFDSAGNCLCWDCVTAREEEEANEEERPYEETSSDDLSSQKPPELALLVPALPDRPARLVSLEQEIMGSGQDCARNLYDAGITSSPELWPYHSGREEFCYVEEDGSVDGEVIYSRLRLDHPMIARRLESALLVMQETIQDGDASLSSSCGFHVHVGLGYSDGIPCYSMQAVESLYHLWNHLEDTIFRLGSANWSKHRTEISDSNYSPATHKGLTGTTRIGRTLQSGRSALNLSHFLSARGSCHCGAFDFGSWSECTCDLSKPTVEFRVFNATANKRKIRAYVALCLALVAYAESNTVTEESHPCNEWQGTDNVNTDSEELLRFILRTLPLTENEREDIRYCAERSSLKKVVNNIRRAKGYATRLSA